MYLTVSEDLLIVSTKEGYIYRHIFNPKQVNQSNHDKESHLHHVVFV